MRVKITAGDPVVLLPEHAAKYRRQYGPEPSWLWVTYVDVVQGRRRLYLNGPPYIVWPADVKKRPLRPRRPRRGVKSAPHSRRVP